MLQRFVLTAFESRALGGSVLGFSLLARFNQALRARGIMKGESKYYVSVAHTRADIDHTIQAWTEAVAELTR